MADEQLTRFLARSGVSSRRGAATLVTSGVVRINGLPARIGMRVDADRDQVTVRGTRVRPPGDSRYLALNKPVGVIVTAHDPQHRRTVFDLLPEEERSRHLFAVGRLDVDSGGLLLLTDDGELAYRVTHPRFEVPKEYEAVVTGTLGDRELRRLRRGMELEDGPTAPAKAEVLSSWQGLCRVRIVIAEGRKRQVRRMFDAVGHPVKKLTRLAVGPVRLGRLRVGGYRRLTDRELAALAAAVGRGREE